MGIKIRPIETGFLSAALSQFLFTMAKSREQKQQIIEELKDKLNQQKALVFLGFQGVNSSTLFNLRNELKKAGCRLIVVKKTLLKKALTALKQSGLIEKLNQIEQETALVLGFEDELLPAKISQQFAKENENLQILGGALEQETLSQERVMELAQMPGREELLSRLAGSLSSPMSQLVNVLQGNIKGLVYVLARTKT